MDANNRFPQLVEIARRLPPYPWDQRFSSMLETLPSDQWPSDEEWNAEIAVELPVYLAEEVETIDAAQSAIDNGSHDRSGKIESIGTKKSRQRIPLATL
ncbi:hypothetical protein M4951_21370 [Blastopirellula sp. J2-11]|uniref:hypothetical protein n=1 Tax=Blastopirellula sp. J2-11 TaxID=2943192 RepID=UPI0021C8FDC7|nr:hypothetical protein [Blastopirellula sp. J2-11]UUO05904.1 hypothetical protein M4951_21370 [Blastopirellula sp. J2-11]